MSSWLAKARRQGIIMHTTTSRITMKISHFNLVLSSANIRQGRASLFDRSITVSVISSATAIYSCIELALSSLIFSWIFTASSITFSLGHLIGCTTVSRFFSYSFGKSSGSSSMEYFRNCGIFNLGNWLEFPWSTKFYGVTPREAPLEGSYVSGYINSILFISSVSIDIGYIFRLYSLRYNLLEEFSILLF